MISANDFGVRLCAARAQLEARGRISYRQIATVIAEKTARKKAHRETSVGRWIKGENFPDVPSICALAEMFEVDPGWLAFGELSNAPAPGLTTQAKIVEMIGKTQKVVRDEKPKAAAPKRKKAQKG